MRYILTFLMLFGIAYGQSTYHIRYDTVKIVAANNGQTTIRPGELVLKSSTRDSTNGVLLNIGDGITKFTRIRAINDSQFQVGADVITIRGGVTAAGNAGTVTNVSATNSTGITWTITNPTTTPDISLSLTSAAVGLSNVDNTSDLLKPLSTATIAALALKQNNISLTTTGTSGAATFDGTTLNVPNYAGGVTSVNSLTGAVTITDANLSFSDITTNNASTTQHGFLKKLNSDATMFMRGDGEWMEPRHPEYEFYNETAAPVQILFSTWNRPATQIVGTAALGDNQTRYEVFTVKKTTTVTGIIWWQTVAGVYVSDQYNGGGVYSINTTTGEHTLVTSTANDGDIWKGTANAYYTKAFPSPVALTPGKYAIAFLYCSSSATTAPSVGVVTGTQNGNAHYNGIYRINGINGAESSLPSSLPASDVTVSATVSWFGLY
jgi:hypothetical protein